MSSSFLSKKTKDTGPITQICQRRLLQRVARQDLDELPSEAPLKQVTSIISQNLASGRAGWVMTGRRAEELNGPALQTYVDRVIDCYLQEHRRVEGLVAQNGTAWTRLYDQLTRWAWYTLQRYQVSSMWAADEAQDMAQEACEAIFAHHFPYDVPFDAWVGRILLNRILQQRTRSRELIEHHAGIVSLDQPRSDAHDDGFSLHDVVTDCDCDAAFERMEQLERFLKVVACPRSHAQRQVMIGQFFYGLGDDEIARWMGKTKPAVWSLRYRAMRNLRKKVKQPLDR